MLAVGFALPVNARSAAAPPDWEAALVSALDWIGEAAPDGPQIGGVVGEWAIIALARAGRVDADSAWLRPWREELAQTAALRRWTDAQRVVLALDALGLDAGDFRDFSAPFRVFVPVASRAAGDRTVLADIYAVRALDVLGLESRWYAAHLLHRQRADGTWSLNPAQPTSAFDIDITAMAVQALAQRYTQGEARAVRGVGLALEWLFAQEFTNAESTAQMLAALTRLGGDYAEEAAYFAQKLTQWYAPTLGGFIRPSVPTRVNAIATVQAAYALSAYRLFADAVNADAADVASADAADAASAASGAVR